MNLSSNVLCQFKTVSKDNTSSLRSLFKPINFNLSTGDNLSKLAVNQNVLNLSIYRVIIK